MSGDNALERYRVSELLQAIEIAADRRDTAGFAPEDWTAPASSAAGADDTEEQAQ